MNLNNRLFLFWKIGKNVCERQKKYENIFLKVSNYLSYYFGMSEFFSIVNVKYMKKFYCCFPFYYKELNYLSFEHYKLLVNIRELKERYFYFRIALFCQSSFYELKEFIINDLYNYI